MFRSLAIRGVVWALAIVSYPAAAQVWDAARDFQTVNPAGQWSYGWKTAPASSLTLFPTYEATVPSFPGRDAWQDLGASSVLAVYHNTVGVTGDIPTNTLLLQPDIGKLPVVEWTAPANMAVSVQGFFQSLDTTSSVVNVVSSVSGTRFSATVSSGSPVSLFGLFLNVTAGERLDFVASGGGSGVNAVVRQLNLVGNATLQSLSATDTRLRLTTNGIGQLSGAWAASKQKLDDGFDSTFLFDITQLTGGGADGFAFVLQNSSATALGNGGGGMGYGGMLDSLAVEFDTYQNTDPGWNDPNDNHIGVHTAGIAANSPLESFSIGRVIPTTNMSDGQWHLVRLLYVVQPTHQLSIYFDNMSTPVLQVAVDIASTLQLTDGTAWVGLTGATGGATEVHDIQNWHFQSFDVHPPVLTLPANLTVEGNISGGAQVSYTASALDAVDGSRPVACLPASGGLFPVGVTTVNCSSTDLSGNTSTGSFTVTVTDTTPPSLTVPLNVTAAAVDHNGAPVSYIATATDIVDGPIVPVCVPASGSVFPLGTTTVACTATDHAGNQASQSFPVTVQDVTPPQVSPMSNLTVEATGALTPVSWSAGAATDNVDGSLPVTCVAASGSQFSVGTTTVQCSATDAGGNTASVSFTVTVHDTTPPVISGMPSNLTLEATSPAGAVTNWPAPTASDLVDGAVTVTCAPASGSQFALGTTTVTCSATDAHGNSASSSFTVKVHDTTPPVIGGMPSNMTLEAAGPAGAVANWPAPTASDLVDGAVTVTCAPASGSQFALGTTSVSCTATDAHGNSASSSFTVKVQDTTPPTISGMPSNLTLEATGPAGAVANWPAPTASDLVDGAVTVTCAPASGSQFALKTTTVTCSATDAHNSSASSSFTVKVQDTTLPVISCGTPDGLWHSADVTIACTARDSVSGLANAADASFSLTTGVPAGAESANATTNSHTVCDVAGNCAIAGPIAGNHVDKRPPSITIASPVNGTYTLNQSVAASYSCADGGSGVASCSGPVASGSPIDTASVGSKQFVVNALDHVGNASASSVTYSVSARYTVIYNTCVLSATTARQSDRTLPIRLQVCDAAGANLSSQQMQVTALSVVGANGASLPAADAGGSNPGGLFRYVGAAGGGAYLFNLQTKGLAPGAYQLMIYIAGDPTPHAIGFQVVE